MASAARLSVANWIVPFISDCSISITVGCFTPSRLASCDEDIPIACRTALIQPRTGGANLAIGRISSNRVSSDDRDWALTRDFSIGFRLYIFEVMIGHSLFNANIR